ncbi:MAG: hypothetical protein AAB441_01390 [Patescibacteria group bacterium]
MKTNWPTKKLRVPMKNHMNSDDPVNILHKYFIWANRMRTHFDDILEKHGKRKIDEHSFGIESMMYMSLWYGLLYVVIEGWKTLKLNNSIIDSLLKSPNTDLLNRYRNAVFHFPKIHKYLDQRFENFYKEKTTVEWVRKLNLEFGRYFLQYFRVKTNEN